MGRRIHEGTDVMIGKTGALLLLATCTLAACGDGSTGGSDGAAQAADALDPGLRLDTGQALDTRQALDTGQVMDMGRSVDAERTVGSEPSQAERTGEAVARDVAAPEQSVTRSAERPAAGGTPEEARTVPDGTSPDAILRATSRAYEGLRSFRATFQQTLQNTLLGRTTRSEGTLYQRQPDRFLMEFTDPPEDVIVSDGQYFWMYFPSVDRKQVIRTPRGAGGLDLRSQFIGDPVRRFGSTYHGTESVRGRRAHVMTLVPRENLGYQRLKVWIDADDHLVRRFALTESNGNIRHFELTDLARNPTLSDDLFEFTPPPGSQVVER